MITCPSKNMFPIPHISCCSTLLRWGALANARHHVECPIATPNHIHPILIRPHHAPRAGEVDCLTRFRTRRPEHLVQKGLPHGSLFSLGGDHNGHSLSEMQADKASKWDAAFLEFTISVNLDILKVVGLQLEQRIERGVLDVRVVSVSFVGILYLWKV